MKKILTTIALAIAMFSNAQIFKIVAIEKTNIKQGETFWIDIAVSDKYGVPEVKLLNPYVVIANAINYSSISPVQTYTTRPSGWIHHPFRRKLITMPLDADVGLNKILDNYTLGIIINVVELVTNPPVNDPPVNDPPVNDPPVNDPNPNLVGVQELSNDQTPVYTYTDLMGNEIKYPELNKMYIKKETIGTKTKVSKVVFN